MLFLYSGEMGIIMNENKLKIHANSGEIIENDRETGENFYESLRFQLDESKNTIQNIHSKNSKTHHCQNDHRHH